jgi:hypothetical protein
MKPAFPTFYEPIFRITDPMRREGDDKKRSNSDVITLGATAKEGGVNITGIWQWSSSTTNTKYSPTITKELKSRFFHANAECAERYENSRWHSMNAGTQSRLVFELVPLTSFQFIVFRAILAIPDGPRVPGPVCG